MARRYTRDNRGRFSSTGATARGGRLKTASGNKRAAQTKGIAGGKPAGTVGKPKGAKPAASKTAGGRYTPTTNGKGQVVGMRDRTKPAPSPAAVAQAARSQRANRNLNAAMAREGDGPNSKASRSASVAKRAGDIYKGKVDPKQKTKARLTKTSDPEALRKRTKKIKDNTLKPAAAKPAAKPAASKVSFDQAAWQRRASRAKNAGLVRASKEVGNPIKSKADKKVYRAYATRVKAEQFYQGLTKDRTDKTGRTLVRGAEGMKQNFNARPRRGTASTSIGVAARNRQYEQARLAKREANKQARIAAAAKPAASKAERVLGRVTANAKRAAGGSDAKSARSSAVALLAQSSLSSRAVGKRDPNRQYPRAELVAGLNKSMSKPLPKSQRASTGRTRNKGEQMLQRDAAASLIRFNRRKRKP